MITVTDAEFQKQFGHYKKAAQKEPVHVTSFNQEGVVLLSSSEYEAYERMKKGMRQALYAHEIPEGDFPPWEELDIPEEARQYDHEWQS